MDTYKPPKEKLNRLAKSLFDTCEKYYSDPENVKKFEEWKKQKGEENKKNKK